MKLVQIRMDWGVALGIQTEKGVIDVQAEAERRGVWAPVTMLEAIQGGEAAQEVLKELSRNAECFTEGAPAPVVTGGDKILCIGLNYRRHAAECGMELPEAPVVFNKFANTLASDEEAICLPPEHKEYDYEAELVAVMGKRARNVPESEALSYVFGYTCGNDLSTRDLQFVRGNQWVLSKSLDGFGPVGPCLVTAEEIDPQNLDISCRVNGELRQSSNTSDMIFTVAQIISDLSKYMTLEPGDLIFTGTPEGVMHGYPADKKNWLKSGDVTAVTIEKIGTLTNTMV